jgi:hypothetical protein
MINNPKFPGAVWEDKLKWPPYPEYIVIRTAFLLNLSKADLFLPFANICYFATLAKRIIISLVKVFLFYIM